MDPKTEASVSRFVGGVVGLAFFGIGLGTLGFLWGAPFGEFDSPPLVFRVFGSFIAVVFVAVGGAVAFASIVAKQDGAQPQGETGDTEGQAPPKSALGYACPKCGASLAKGATVSPLGDVNCTFCGSWFNIHGKNASDDPREH